MQLLYYILLSLLAFVTEANAGVFWRYNTSGTPTLFDSGVDISGSVTASPTTPLSMVLVGVHWNETSGIDNSVTVTYGGVAMTEIVDDGFGPFLNVFKLVNPPVGSQGALALWAGGSGLGIAAVISVIGFTGTSATEGITSANATSTTPSVTIGTFTTGSLGVSFYTVDLVLGASVATVGSGETQRVNRNAGTVPATNAFRALVSTQDMGGDGVMNYSLSTSRTWFEAAFGLTAGAPPRGVIGPGMVQAP